MTTDPVPTTTAEASRLIIERVEQASRTSSPAEAAAIMGDALHLIAVLMRDDPYGFAVALADEHRALSARLDSWAERDRVWKMQLADARSRITPIASALEGLLQDIAVAHRKRTNEARLELPGGTSVGTTQTRQPSARIVDPVAFLAAIPADDLDLVSELPVPERKLLTDKAKGYALEALTKSGEELPGVEVTLAGVVTAQKVKHGAAGDAMDEE